MEERKRKLDSPVARGWLLAEGELRITSSTTDDEIAEFTTTVGEGQPELKKAISAIVAQAKDEIKKKNDRALLVCKTYYLKWRGPAWKGRDASERRKRTEKGRYGLFLVRGCQRCRVITKDGNKQPATAAVFRIPAYHPTPRAASVRKTTQSKAKGTAEVHGVTEGPKKCRCNEHNEHDTAKPWKCKCCKHLYCPGHGDNGASNVKRADCTKCKADKWNRRSISANGNVTLKPRKALSSCYESLRAGVFFVDKGLTKDMAEYLLSAYETTSGRAASQESQGSAEQGQESTARAESIAEKSSADSENVASTPGFVSKSPLASASNEASGPEAQPVPKIALGKPLRASKRSRSKPERLSSFGRMV